MICQILYEQIYILYIKMFKRLSKYFTLAATITLSTPAITTNDGKKNTSTFIWGNGYYQARPDAIMQFNNFEPKRIANFTTQLSLKHVEFSENFEAGIGLNGKLYVWPAHKLSSSIDFENRDNIRQNVTQLQVNVKQVKFTKDFLWILNNNGQVFQRKIIKNSEGKSDGTFGNKVHVVPFKDIKSISTGQDHIVALNINGEVFAMGQDTLGQCGKVDGRSTSPPFKQNRVRYPQKVDNLPKIQKIFCGKNHSLAIDQRGEVYGWGSNSNMQLSHQQQFSRVNPLLCSFKPIRLMKNLENVQIYNIGAGKQFTILCGYNKFEDSYAVYSVGNNIRGQLGIGLIKHVNDITKITQLSNYVHDTQNEKDKKVKIQMISCGNNHCIALLNIGYIFTWGDNQYGQIGNKKRSTVYNPVIIRQFMKSKVLGVFAGQNNSAVIVEDQ